MNISILFFSKTGYTAETAEQIATGIRQEGEIEVRLFNIADGDVDADFVNSSAAVIVGTPTYSANSCWQIDRWFDEDDQCHLAGKLGAAFSTAAFQQGGADIAANTIIGHMLVKGMLVYSAGCSLGQPFSHLGAVTLNDRPDINQEMAIVFGQRIARKALELF